MPEVSQKCMICYVGDRSGQFHSSGATSDNNKREVLFTLHLVRGGFGYFITQQNPFLDGKSVIEGLQRKAVFSPVILAEISRL